MKTSNKILIGLAVIIIVIPLIITKVFKYKIAHGQFTADTVEPSKEIPQIIQRGNLANYKVIKIIGPDTVISPNDADLFTCKIDYAMQAQYSFWKQEKTDSMEMRQSGDTLIFQYRNKLAKNDLYHANYLRLTLSIPQWVPVILDHSRLVMDESTSVQLTQNDGSPAVFYPLNHSILQLGTNVHAYKIDSANSGPGRIAFLTDTSALPEQEIMPFDIHIHANHSQVNLYNHPLFNSLSLNMADSSSLTINKGFTAKNLTGNIDPKTNIETSAAAITSLTAIIK